MASSRMKSRPKSAGCPCGSETDYASCCQPLHDAKMPAESAEQLMRSRYSAYVLQREDYLLTSWHADTRPPSLDLGEPQPTPSWLALEVRQHARQDDEHVTVEFIARFRVGGGRAERLHEISRFVRVDGHWYYLDGEIKESPPNRKAASPPL